MKERHKAIEDWVEYIKKNKDWKKHHTKFINAQYELAYRSIKKMKKLPNGNEIIADIYKIKNKKGYPNLISR